MDRMTFGELITQDRARSPWHEKEEERREKNSTTSQDNLFGDSETPKLLDEIREATE